MNEYILVFILFRLLSTRFNSTLNTFKFCFFGIIRHECAFSRIISIAARHSFPAAILSAALFTQVLGVCNASEI